MAALYPDRIKPDASEAERRLFAVLEKLPDSWTVLHSVAWQAKKDGKPSDGEADFVVVHPRYGVIVIEVKGGGIRREGEKWFSFNSKGRHQIKDPFQQATASKHSLISYLRAGRLPYLAAGHAVAFPDVSQTASFGPNAPTDLILTRVDLRDIEAGLTRVVAHWQLDTELTDDQINLIIGLLSPTTTVRPLLRDQLAEVEARLLHLTEQQFIVLDTLRRHRRALILGGAGTGKTVLAVERARRLAYDGFSVLLTCFNRPLALHLAKEFGDPWPIKVYSFHQLVNWQVRSAGMSMPEDPEQEWWDRISADQLVEAAGKNGLRFDAVVVDEGQDFPPQWFTALEMILANPGEDPFYVFADIHQAIYRAGWEPPFPGEPFLLSINCRNTVPIARVVSQVFGDEMSSRGVEGPEPVWVEVESREGGVKAVSTHLHRLVNEGGLKPGQVAVLTQGRQMADELCSATRAGLKLTRLDEGGVTCETIHRFKGLEADAVIVVLEDMADEQDRQLAYIGLSRAKSMLVVVGPGQVLKSLRTELN
ncbi:MAG TPA: NERD domain-containing protein/DEAD/DEAH box helicase [Acidimicrobiia bacterium]|nr:NERD domain-containing protein/DEAD/DEAH box helicase [Acidimicrobiia bacterium]